MNGNLIAVVFAVAFVEMFLSGTWNRFYFLYGVPLFRGEVSGFSAGRPLPQPATLEANLPESIMIPLIFRRLGDSEYGFREKIWGGFFRFSYTPVMHGLLVFERPAGRVVVRGFANWFTVVFSVVWVFLTIAMEAPGFSLFVVALLGAIYAIQAKRFRQVLAVASTAWSRAEACVSPLGAAREERPGDC